MGEEADRDGGHGSGSLPQTHGPRVTIHQTQRTGQLHAIGVLQTVLQANMCGIHYSLQ
jgi:hypothetical protein